MRSSSRYSSSTVPTPSELAARTPFSTELTRCTRSRINDRGQSPLAGAVFKNEVAVIEALLEGGADPYAGEPSAYDSAKMFGKLDLWGEKFEGAKGRTTPAPSS